MKKIAIITRPDLSKDDLNRYKAEGYTTVYFETNLEADPDCEALNGNIYVIDELLKLDNSLYRISHPECRCKFKPYQKNKIENTHTNTIEETKPEIEIEEKENLPQQPINHTVINP